MRWTLLVLLLCIAAPESKATSDVPASADSSLTITAKLDKATFTADEPIDVTVTLVNRGEKDVWLGGSAVELSMFRFALKNADGQDVAPTSYGKKVLKSPVSVFRNMRVTLPPGQQRYVIFPLRRMFDLGEGERFSLSVSRGVPSLPLRQDGFSLESFFITAPLMQFSVAPPLNDEPPSEIANTFGARLESVAALPERPFWLELERVAGAFPQIQVSYSAQNGDSRAASARSSFILVPLLRQGDALLASLTNQERAKIDRARVFDLSLDGAYVLTVSPALGQPRELRFHVDNRAIAYKAFDLRVEDWNKLLKPLNSKAQENTQ